MFRTTVLTQAHYLIHLYMHPQGPVLIFVSQNPPLLIAQSEIQRRHTQNADTNKTKQSIINSTTSLTSSIREKGLAMSDNSSAQERFHRHSESRTGGTGKGNVHQNNVNATRSDSNASYSDENTPVTRMENTNLNLEFNAARKGNTNTRPSLFKRLKSQLSPRSDNKPGNKAERDNRQARKEAEKNDREAEKEAKRRRFRLGLELQQFQHAHFNDHMTETGPPPWPEAFKPIWEAARERYPTYFARLEDENAEILHIDGGKLRWLMQLQLMRKLVAKGKLDSAIEAASGDAEQSGVAHSPQGRPSAFFSASISHSHSRVQHSSTGYPLPPTPPPFPWTPAGPTYGTFGRNCMPGIDPLLGLQFTSINANHPTLGTNANNDAANDSQPPPYSSGLSESNYDPDTSMGKSQ